MLSKLTFSPAAQGQDFTRHSQAVVEKTHLAPFSVIPTDWNFTQVQSGTMREIEQLDIKRKTFDVRGLQNRSTNIKAKCFETALRVPKRQARANSNEQIENAPGLCHPMADRPGKTS